MATNFRTGIIVNKYLIWNGTTLLLLLLSGCNEVFNASAKAVGVDRTFHQKVGWKATDFFSDKEVIELCHAIEANDLKKMDELINAGVDVNSIGKDNMTPLMWAFPDNKFDRYKKLLDSGANPNIQLSTNLNLSRAFTAGQSVSHRVAETSFPKYFEETIKHGMDYYLKDQRRQDVISVLMLFTRKEELIPRFKLLIAHGWDINHPLFSDDSALLKAIQLERYDLALFLLENGADYNYYNPTTEVKAIHQLVHVQGGLYPRQPSPQAQDYLKVLRWLEDHSQDAALAAATIKLPDRSEGPKGNREYRARKHAARLADEAVRGVNSKDRQLNTATTDP
jgi:ankyrin repeat protein